ncbi:hypothetical protein [Luteimonas sp. R10]|uniref:hypothetical protein n=1 Tax=Luteimonas sp. R10 TaxID=3108176 RepID=UPI003086B52B|nr:hypothetical protein U3649_18335 [Luteimonas sp. R10]
MSRLLLLVALLSAAAWLPARAASPVRLEIVDRDTGEWLSQHRHRGDTWVAGTPGRPYAVRITNDSGQRVLVVLSVDGVNAVTGQTADPGQAGYVLAPWQSAEIAGWRKSLDDVAGFVFTGLPDSYAARTGRPRHVGVIGLAVFAERRHAPVPASPPPIAGNERRARAIVPQSAQSAEVQAADSAHGASRQRIGTGHGEREWSPTRHTGFVRASTRPMQVTQLRYDTPQRLAAMGVLPRPYAWRRHHGTSPQAFPGSFVADPR